MVLLLCCSLVSGACFNRYSMKVHAAALSAEAGVEAMMLLWNLMINSMVVTGAGELVANYDNEKLTFEAFMDALSYEVLNAPDPNECGYVTLEDGTKIGLVDVLDGVEDGSIDIPDIGDWGGLRDRSEDDYDDPEDEILKRWDEIDAAWKEKHGGSLPDPSEGPQFSKIQEFLLSAGVVTALVDTMEKLWGGQIEALNMIEEYSGLGYSGSLTPDENGYYQYKGFTSLVLNGVTNVNLLECSSSERVAAYFTGIGSNLHCSQSMRYTSYNNKYGTFRETASGSSVVYSSYNDTFVYRCNFPVFSTSTDMYAYLETGDDSLAINKAKTDLGVLITCTPEIISPLVDKQLSPSVLQSTYTGMKSAYQTQIKPQLETDTDTATNTKTYQDVMTEVITETVPGTSTGTDTGTETEPDTGTTPGTGTGSGTGTDTGTGTESDEDIDIENYKVDLRQVFPFCIPFDFIALLRVLDAEPETPRFEIPFVVPSVGIDETFVIDLSMFDDVMEVIRVFELVSFVLGLMLLTGKVIKW